MSAEALLALGAVGLAAGLVAGLVGIGGGVLMVPFLYFVYGHGSWSGVALAPETEAVVAHATSLFVIVPTAVRGSLAYHRAGLVEWRVVLPVGLAAAAAAVGGARLALLLRPEALKLAFGLFLLGSAAKLVWGAGGAGGAGRLRLGWARVGATGIAVGLLSALLGVGGGLVAIPLLVHVVGLELRRVAATSLGVVACAAVAGAATYVMAGWGAPGLPPGSLGYVHVAAAFPMLVTSLWAVGLGARINRRLRGRALAWLFGALFAAIGLGLVVDNARALL